MSELLCPLKYMAERCDECDTLVLEESSCSRLFETVNFVPHKRSQEFTHFTGMKVIITSRLLLLLGKKPKSLRHVWNGLCV